MMQGENALERNEILKCEQHRAGERRGGTGKKKGRKIARRRRVRVPYNA